MKLIVTVLGVLGVVLLNEASATVTLQFSSGNTGATNFANNAGIATDGMSWGVVVDTTGNGFSSGSYDPFANISLAQVLAVGGSASDDYFVPSGLVTQTLGAPFFTGVEAGAGSITSISNVPFGSVGGLSIDAGDKFALIWFDSNSAASGAYYGTFTHASFSIPADGNTTDFSALAFNGADPVRSASLQFTAVPEPSRMLLLGFGALGLLMRRRRQV